MTTISEKIRITVTDSARALARVRAWFDPPLEADAKPLEIREAIIEQVVQCTEPVGGGRRVLPHNHVTVTILGGDKDERVALHAALDDVESAICARLREIRCQPPAGFRLTLQYVRRPRSGWTPGQRIALDYESRGIARTANQRSIVLPTLRVTVIRGEATQPVYAIADALVRVGRSAAPTDDRGRPRHNQIAFLEDGNEHAATVGRAHASIRYDAERGEYRLFDDGSRNGTRIVRDGTTLDVLPRDPVGVTILTGDEIQFGSAAISIAIEEAAITANAADHQVVMS